MKRGLVTRDTHYEVPSLEHQESSQWTLLVPEGSINVNVNGAVIDGVKSTRVNGGKPVVGSQVASSELEGTGTDRCVPEWGGIICVFSS